VNREQLAWALVGWFNLLALLVVSVIIARITGHSFVLSGSIILAIALLTLAVVGLLLWLMMRRSS
jgi:hypothetical protein